MGIVSFRFAISCTQNTFPPLFAPFPGRFRDTHVFPYIVTPGGFVTPTSHKRGDKRVAAAVLPHPEVAPANKPRGKESLMQDFDACIHKGAKVIGDGWEATASAAQELGMEVKQCNHTANFRNRNTGAHSNDAESEVARFKRWSRGKWGFTCILNDRDQAKKKEHMERHLSEYIAETNMGTGMVLGMGSVSRAFAGLADLELHKPRSLNSY